MKLFITPRVLNVTYVPPERVHRVRRAPALISTYLDRSTASNSLNGLPVPLGHAADAVCNVRSCGSFPEAAGRESPPVTP